MSHEIETFQDGTAAFFSARKTPWHRLGTVTPNCLTAEDAMRVAQLDWTVEKHPIQVPVLDENGVTVVDAPDKFATVRNHPKLGYQVLGAGFGSQYTPIQNIDNAEFLNALADVSGARFETAGSLYGGKRVFVSMKMPKGIQVGGSDLVDTYLVATNSHDGSTAFTVAVTPVRVVCANTLAFGLRQAKAHATIRHTKNANQRIQQAREALGMTLGYMDEFSAAANHLYEQEMTNREFNELVAAMWPQKKGESPNAAAARDTRSREMAALFTKAPTNDNGRGTRWGAYNAITEWLDWAAPVRAAGRDADEHRATRTAVGATDAEKRRAFAALAS